jgi:predicted DNA binding protein
MPAYDAQIKLVHDCFYSKMTQMFPEATVAMWCNGNSHVFEVSCPEAKMVEEVESYLLREEVGGSSIRQGSAARIVSQRCDCPPGASTIICQAGGWVEEPIIYKGGWEYYRIIAHEKDYITEAVKGLKESGAKVELVSLKAFTMRGVAEDLVLASSRVLAGMTDRQVKALAEACNHGYFSEPSKVDLDTLAKRSGLSRSTYAEHLRKAEAKLLANLSAIIQLAADQA